MAVGQKGFNPSAKVVRFDNTPVPAGIYDMRLKPSSVTIDRSKEKDPSEAVPYVKVNFNILGTADEDKGTKDKLHFHRLFLSNEPGKDGNVNWARGGGLLDLARATVGEVNVPNFGSTNMGDISHVNPQEVVEWLKGLGDVVVKAKLKVKKGSGGYNPSNDVEYWIPDEGEQEEKPAEKPVPIQKAGKKAGK